MISGIRCSARRRKRSVDVGCANAEFANCFARSRSKRERVRDLRAVSLAVGFGSDESDMSSPERSSDCDCVVGADCVGLDRIWFLIELIFSFLACVCAPVEHLSNGKLLMSWKLKQPAFLFATVCHFSIRRSNL